MATVKRWLVVTALLLAGCHNDGDPAATAGILTLALTSGGATDGAMVLVVSGGPIVSVAAPTGYQVATNADGEGTHVMVVGALSVGALATITVPDMSRAAGYVATVIQVSDRNSFALLDAGPYRVSVHP